jgi:hypothetical protein
MEGDELAFIGGGRVFRTNQCYDPMPTLGRDSHSRAGDGKSWRTRCATAPNDPRKAVLNSLVVVTTETQIDLVETGRYEILLENGRCMADVKRTRTFTLVQDDKKVTPAPVDPTPAPTKTPEPPRPSTCAAPGDPAKLEVRPSKKLVRTDEGGFKFRALVLDGKGCETHTATTWKVAPESAGKGVTVDGLGRVTVAKGANEGSVEIIATAAGRDARVVVEVVSPAHYDELLARQGLNAAGENDEASSVTIASVSIGAGEGKVEDRARERRFIFLAIVGGVLLALAIVGVVLFRRSRRAKALLDEADERHEARVRDVLDRRRQREEEHAQQMRAHEASVVAARDAVEKAKAAASASAELVCPSCRRQQPAGVSFCPHDGTKLEAAKATMPLSAMAARSPGAGAPKARGKICPTCGSRFEGAAEFCGKDGTVLVLLN